MERFRNLPKIDVVEVAGVVWDNLVIVFTIAFLVFLVILLIVSTAIGIILALALVVFVAIVKGLRMVASRCELNEFDR